MLRGFSSAYAAMFILAPLASLALVCSPRVARAEVQLAEDDEVERPDAAALIGSAPPGRPMDLRLPRPALGKGAEEACSFRVPACVHAPSATPPASVLSALAAAERAWEAYTGPMALPPPDASLATGALDLYLVTGAPLDAEAYLDERDPRSRVDRANAFVVLDARLAQGCPIDAAVAYGVARSIGLTVAPATDLGSARAQAQSLAAMIEPCAMGRSAGDVSMVQSHPELSFADSLVDGDLRTRASFSRGAHVFYTWLDEAYGQYPGAIVSAMWALSPTTTEAGAARWNNEPDGFDVLRKSFKGALSTGSEVEDLYLDFAVARAFQGSRSDGKHGLSMSALADGGAVLFDWEVDFPEHPRALSTRRPLAPLGSAYFVVRTGSAPPNARLRLEAFWEEHARVKLAIVKVDKDGKELGRLAVGSVKKAIAAGMSVVDLTGVDRLLIVAVNTGDPAFQFDPDDEAWEPHGLVVSIAPE